MVIYVAYPYGRSRNLSQEEIEANVQASIELGRRLIEKGHVPMIPNLYHFVHDGWEDSPNEDVWFDIASGWIERCDALFYGGSSTGTNAERRIAFGLRLPIYYTLDEVPSNTEAELLQDPEIRREYEALEPKYARIQRALEDAQ